MNSKQRKAAEKAAKATVAKRHEEPKPVAESKVKTEKAAKEPRADGMPDLPKMPSAKRPRKPKPQQECTCGCGGMTTSQWVPGHDARARGWAIRIERDIIKMNDVPANERAGAKFMLEERKKAGLTGKGITLAKGKSTEKKAEQGATLGDMAEGGEAVNE